MKKTTFTLLFFLSCCRLAAQCPTGNVSFSTQGQIDSFPINYPNCSEIDSNVIIFGSSIVRLDSLYSLKKIGGQFRIDSTMLTDLSGLNGLDSVYSSLRISDNPVLATLSGLSKLKYVGGVYSEGSGFNFFRWGLAISGNPLLTSLDGLEELKTVEGCVRITGNPSLISLTKLSSLTLVGNCQVAAAPPAVYLGLEISYNDSLKSLAGLDSLQYLEGGISINFNPSLKSLVGLDNIRYIEGSLGISYNPSLKSLAGLDNLQRIEGGLGILNNDSLATLSGLENLDSLGKCLRVWANQSLTSLDALNGVKSIGTCVNWQYPNETFVLSLENNPVLSSIAGLTNSTFHYFNQWGKLWIRNCPSLSICELQPVCAHLESGKPATISDNAPGCNSVAEIQAACAVPTHEFFSEKISLSPNPASAFLNIEILENTAAPSAVEIFDAQGRLQYRQRFSPNQQIDIQKLAAGFYFLKMLAGEGVYAGRFVKL